MKELIKEAESLYEQIGKIQLDLVKSRLDVCEERKWKAISEMETSVCNVFHLLKCIMERKDNIVDLSEVWHKYNPKQEICDDIIACYNDNVIVNVHSQNEIDILLRHNRHLEGKIYFSFVKDLLPKRDSK